MNSYLQKIRSFSRNANLYLIHVVGMDLIWGTWGVLFNLYLLAAGFSLDFIGLRLLVGGVTSAICSIPGGWVSDKIGRKASFIIGDGVGALMAMVSILSTSENVLLATAVISGSFGVLHSVSEPAFMAENSKRSERTHLFSVAAGLSTLAMMIGSIIAGYVPGLIQSDTLTSYRIAASFGILLWFLSLIPAVMLKADVVTTEGGGIRIKRTKVKLHNPVKVGKIVLVSTLVTFSLALAGSLYNVFFHEHAHAGESTIGTTFAISSAILGLLTFLAPVLAQKLGSFPMVIVVRLLALPFILALPFVSTGLHQQTVSVISLVGLMYMGRSLFTNLSEPISDAINMNLLDPRERATATGIQMSLNYAFSGLAGFIGARLMGGGDFTTPFLLMAAIFGLSIVLFYILYKPYREEIETESIVEEAS